MSYSVAGVGPGGGIKELNFNPCGWSVMMIGRNRDGIGRGLS